MEAFQKSWQFLIMSDMSVCVLVVRGYGYVCIKGFMHLSKSITSQHELRITGILDKIDEYRRNWLSHLKRKENNWKTEEALARAAVTLETDQRVQSLMFMMMIKKSLSRVKPIGS